MIGKDGEMELADDILIGVAAISRYVGKTERAVYHMVYNGHLPHFKIGARIHARKSQLDAAFRASITN